MDAKIEVEADLDVPATVDLALYTNPTRSFGVAGSSSGGISSRSVIAGLGLYR